MMVCDVEEMTEVGHPKIKYNENGIPKGISVQEFSDRMLDKLSKKDILTYEILQQHKKEQQRLIAEGIIEKPQITDDVFTPKQEREFNRGITLDDILGKYKVAI